MTKIEMLQMFTRGNASATEFLVMITDIAHVYDDLIDRDVPALPEDIHRAFFNALVVLPKNQFYAQHFNLLHPLLLSAINNWRVANLLEDSEDEDALRIAFISRSSYVDIITQTAFIIGGMAWVEEIGPVIRRFVHEEGWHNYRDSLDREKAARAAKEGD